MVVWFRNQWKTVGNLLVEANRASAQNILAVSYLAHMFIGRNSKSQLKSDYISTKKYVINLLAL